MCGIAGVYYFDGKTIAKRADLEQMTQALAHRGPDGAGTYIQPGIAFGHRRLKIIDLSEAASQPMGNEDGTVWITYNGEFYGYRELRETLAAKNHRFLSHSDTEVILHLYEEYDLNFLDKLDGMYAFAIWDGRKKRLLLVRDRLGIKPLYYFVDSAHLVFASELKSLLVDPSIPRNWDHEGLSHFLRLMSIPDPLSIFQGVKKLLPGHYLLAEKGSVAIRAYWDVDTQHVDEDMNLQGACEEFGAHWKRSVQSHLVADVPVGVFLSGGVDSSAVAWAASQEVGEGLNSFSFIFPGDSAYDEGGHAKVAAGHIHSHHHEFQLHSDLAEVLPRFVTHCDEPFAVSSSLALYLLAQFVSRHVKVVLTGDGADEIFGGYPWRHGLGWEDRGSLASLCRQTLTHVLKLFQPLSPVPRVTRALAKRLLPPGQRYLASLSVFDDAEMRVLVEPEVWGRLNEKWADNLIVRHYRLCKSGEPLTRNLYTDIKTTLVSEMLTKVDRMTMAFGVEARVPFLDHRLVEWAFRVPGRWKLHQGEGKYLIREAMKGHLPSSLLRRPKHGFNVPLQRWLNAKIWQFVRDTLSAERLKKRGIFQTRQVHRLLERYRETKDDRASNQIFILLIFELWCQAFVDR